MFRDRLAKAASETGRPELAHQSLGRSLSAEEIALAAAMMEIYGTGVTDLEELAEQLSARNVAVPGNPHAIWDLDTLETVLGALNADLDSAYRDNGYGA